MSKVIVQDFIDDNPDLMDKLSQSEKDELFRQFWCSGTDNRTEIH